MIGMVKIMADKPERPATYGPTWSTVGANAGPISVDDLYLDV